MLSWTACQIIFNPRVKDFNWKCENINLRNTFITLFKILRTGITKMRSFHRLGIMKPFVKEIYVVKKNDICLKPFFG